MHVCMHLCVMYERMKLRRGGLGGYLFIDEGKYTQINTSAKLPLPLLLCKN